MSDTFNIEIVKKFQNLACPDEISDISKIIQQMISIKKDFNRTIKKKTKAYDILEKLKLNGLLENDPIKHNTSQAILKNHIETYDVVEDAIECLNAVDITINNDLFDFYWSIYIEVLTDLNISLEEKSNICNNSAKIYNEINMKIKNTLFDGKSTNIPTNKIVTYVNAISSYVFYKCKFLIPFEDDRYN